MAKMKVVVGQVFATVLSMLYAPMRTHQVRQYNADGTPKDPVTIWLPDGKANPGKDDLASWGKPEQDLPLHTLIDGWDQVQGTALVREATVAEMDASVQQRKDIITWLLSDPERKQRYIVGADTYDVSNVDTANVLRDMGEEPSRFTVIAAFRRTWAAMFALALSQKMGRIKSYKDYPIYCVVREFADDFSRVVAQFGENDVLGKRKYSNIGNMKNAILLYSLNPFLSEADMARYMGQARGAGQQYHRAARLAASVDGINLAERIGMAIPAGKESAYTPGGYLPLSVLDKEVTATLLGIRETAAGSLREVLPTYGKGTRATLVECEKVFEALITNTVKPRTVLTSKLLAELAANSQADKAKVDVRTLLTAVAGGDQDTIRRLLAPPAKLTPVEQLAQAEHRLAELQEQVVKQTEYVELCRKAVV